MGCLFQATQRFHIWICPQLLSRFSLQQIPLKYHAYYSEGTQCHSTSVIQPVTVDTFSNAVWEQYVKMAG